MNIKLYYMELNNYGNNHNLELAINNPEHIR